MERKIGEIFEYNGEWYQCVESACNKECYFYNKSLHKTIADINGNGFEACNACFRNDNKSVIFKKLEKVGEPYEHYEKFYQCYKLPMETEIRLLPNNCYPIGKDNLVEIEIKQTKEDMEEKELNLKPFDIQKARAGKPVCTRDGRKARVLCYDFKQNEEYPILVAVENKDGKECALLYSNDGISEMYKSSNNELVMLPEKKEGWVNIYDDMKMYTSEERAKIGISTERNYITTTKVEWEE